MIHNGMVLMTHESEYNTEKKKKKKNAGDISELR